MAQCLVPPPSELIGHPWVIGDPTRKDGLSTVLTPEGLKHRRREEAAPLLATEWPRFMELQVRAAYRRWHVTRFGGLVCGGGFAHGAVMGREGCSLQGIVRHPYEPWSVRYTQHERGYTGGHVIVLKALLDRLTEAKALDRLGMPSGWVRRLPSCRRTPRGTRPRATVW